MLVVVRILVHTGTWLPRQACCRCVHGFVGGVWKSGVAQIICVCSRTQLGSCHGAASPQAGQPWNPLPHTACPDPCSAAAESKRYKNIKTK